MTEENTITVNFRGVSSPHEIASEIHHLLGQRELLVGQRPLNSWVLDTYKKASAASRKENGAPNKTSFIALVILAAADRIASAVSSNHPGNPHQESSRRKE